MSDELRNETEYFATREEQLLAALERKHGLSRGQLLKLGALGLPVLAGFGRLAAPRAARAAGLVAPPIVKPLPPEWFTSSAPTPRCAGTRPRDLGYTTPNERFFVRNHTATPIIDPATWRLSVFGSGLQRARRASHALAARPPPLPRARAHRVHRVRRQRPQLLRRRSRGRRRPARSGSWRDRRGRAGAASRLRDVLERAGITRTPST